VKLGRTTTGNRGLRNGPRRRERVGVAAPRHVEADALHRLGEELAVLPLLDGLELRADELDAVLVETPDSASETAQLRPVCPPSVGSSASGRSFSMTFSTNSGVTGST
jgi:hypothetical protein